MIKLLTLQGNIIKPDNWKEMVKAKLNNEPIPNPTYKSDFIKGKNIAGGTTGIDTPFGRSKPLNSVYQYGLEEKNQLQKFCFDWAKECLRVLKPGGFLLSFGGTRTYHRMACGIEDAGFEIRDCIMWIYGSGFPKSLNIGKAVDKMQGNEREVVFKNPYADGHIRKATGNISDANDNVKFLSEYKLENGLRKETKGTSEWEGWGTALKPAVEPIVVARKPLSEKNVALNVLKWGTGGINIDESRVKSDDWDEKTVMGKYTGNNENNDSVTNNFGVKEIKCTSPESTLLGRFPANLIHDGSEEVMNEFAKAGVSKSFKRDSRYNKENPKEMLYTPKNAIYKEENTYEDSGTPARFFYVAKASKSERNFGLENTDIPEKPIPINEPHNSKNLEERYNMTSKNNHPTVKPIKLMEYLIKLVSKENAVILDPFLGSGTTAIACLKTNRKFIGIEKEQEYIKIAEARIKPYLSQQKLI